MIGAPLAEAPRLSALIDAYRNAAEAQVFELALSDATTLLGNLTPVRDETLGLLGRVLTLHDISDLKRLGELKSQMIRMASHDLRNPLNLAFGYLDLLEGVVASSDKARLYIEGVASGLRRMRKLIQDLLDVERIESETERVREPIDVNDLAQRAADELQSQAEDKRHTLTVEPAGEPARVSADPVQMYQVTVNLVSNAIKYTPDGGRIQVRVRRESEAVIFEVADNGLGIPQAAQAKLFQRFYRVKMRGTEDIEGTGLGLSLVKAVVEQHRGTIGVDSQEGQGSTFRVRLPALNESAA
jgi:two-component system phosphate regulon sensor histidine kinase PhoR